MPALYVFPTVPSASNSAKNGSVSANSKLEERKHEAQIGNSKSRWMPNAQVSCAVFWIYSRPICQAAMIRPKQVTDPLNEVVRAKLCGDEEIFTDNYSSGETCRPPDSAASLADLVHNFMEDQGEDSSNCHNGIGESCSEIQTEEFAKISQVLEAVSACTATVDLHLLGHVSNVVEIFEEAGRIHWENHMDLENRRNCLRRAVVNRLTAVGFNAGICKSRWARSSDFPAGEYEYIDVIIPEGRNCMKDRVFIDIDFRAQFEVARPTKQYSALVRLLPNIFVGRADTLQQIIGIMCEAAKKSLKTNTMYIPPWRKNRYMRAKWLGPYKRTISPASVPHSSARKSALNQAKMDLYFGSFPNIGDDDQCDTQWEPPSVSLKPLAERPNGKVSRLWGALTEAGLTANFSKSPGAEGV